MVLWADYPQTYPQQLWTKNVSLSLLKLHGQDTLRLLLDHRITEETVACSP